ncbi:hypothetical protein [Janthinobacterium sp. RA13]|uniref:hypothetical protein n=1 Tax=Janthinobacterium sp. RA13 TaxID=1502762 RepID=UPI00126A06C7|nr:hypothetical protein [Janthinobacterium sp. RA13]
MKFVPLTLDRVPEAEKEIDDVSQRIRQRLEHVEMIFNLHHQFRDIKLVQHVGDNGWTHPWRYFDALMYYLLLTCFDLLGQPAEWVSFSEWLESSKKIAERKLAVASIPEGSDPITVTQHINRVYQNIYGVKNSFYNFISNVLTDAERTELYFNIEIVRGRKDGDPHTSYPALGYVNDDKKKLEFLYNLRNKFTHSAVTMGSPNAGISPHAYKGIEENGKILRGYVEIYREAKKNEWLIYQVRDWPFVLHRIILAALTRREEAFHKSNGRI